MTGALYSLLVRRFSGLAVFGEELRVRYGFIVTRGDPLTVAELAREAEGAGWDGAFYWDGIHVGEGWEIYDPWVVMAAMAMRTGRVRIGAVLTPPARRRPWKLARETMTLDHLSGGRLVLPVGLGALDDGGFSVVGEPTERKVRAELLDEEPGDTGRPVERRALQLRGRTLPNQGDDFLASPDPEASYPDLGGRCVAQQEVHEPGAALRWPARLHHSRGGHTRRYPGDESLRRGEQGGERYLRYRMGGCDAGRRPRAHGLYGTPLSQSGRDVVHRVPLVAAQRARRPAPPYRAGAAAHRALKRRDL